MNYTYDENGNIIMLEDPSLNFNNPNNISLLSSSTPISRILSISADQAITGLIRGMANVSPHAAQKRTNISSEETKKTYFPYANEKSFQNDSFQVTQDVDSDLLQRIDTQKFFLDQFNNGIEDKGEFSFTVSLFVSRDGNKIKETYEVTKPGPNEFLLFLEDNTNDYSKQILRARVGKNIREKLTASQLSQTSIFNYVNKHFNLSKSFLFELAARGYVEEKVSVGGYIFKGILYLLSAVFSPVKAVGWIVNQIGDLVDILKIPDAVWDTESDNYIFKKENVISALTMDTEFLDNWYASLENDPTQIEFNDFIPDFISTKAQAAILKIKQFIESYNSTITNFIERLYKKFEGLSEIPFVAMLLENFAFICGLWNGIVDFISSTLKFIGGILESGFNLTSNFESTLETIDSFWDTLTKVQWSDVWEGLGFLINKIKEYFKSNKNEDYNWVRIAYVSGFGIAFIATLFIPFTQVAKLSGFSKLKKLIPESAIKSIVDGVGTAAAKVKTKSKEAYGTFLKNLQKIFAILGKGKTAVKKFFSDIWKRISEWFLKNKEAFKNKVKTTTNNIRVGSALLNKIKVIKGLTITYENGQYVFRYFDVIIKQGTKLKVEKAVDNLLRKGEKAAQKKLNLLVFGTRVPRFLKGMISHIKYGDITIIKMHSQLPKGKNIIEKYKYVLGKGGKNIFPPPFQAKRQASGGIHIHKYLDGTYRRIEQVVETFFLSNGDEVIKAYVEVFIKELGRWLKKKKPSTFFPKNWSNYKIEKVIREASENIIFKKGDKFIGVSKEGFKVEFYYNKVKKGIKTAYLIKS